jgi:cell division septal protein FtsQ
MAKRNKKRIRKIKKQRPKSQVSVLWSMGFKAIPFVVSAVLVFLVFKGIQNLLLNSYYFNIKEIEVADGAPVRSKSSIAKELLSRKNTNIFVQDVKECEYALERLHPELKNIIVYRKLPDTLYVSYGLRTPACQIESGYYYIVSDDGVILSQPQAAKEPGLIIVSGIKVLPKPAYSISPSFQGAYQRAIEIIEDIEESYNLTGDDKIVEVNVYDVANPAIFLEDKTRVELGQHRLRDKSDAIKDILSELKFRNSKARVIDLRFEDVVVVPR